MNLFTKIALFFCLLPWCLSTSIAQTKLLSHLHIDKSVYFTNDTLWYSMVVTENNKVLNSNQAKVGQVILVNQKGENVQTDNVRLQNSKGNSYLKIDSTFATGVYTITSFVAFDVAGSRNTNLQAIYIINPKDFKEFETSKLSDSSKPISQFQKSSINKENINIEISQTQENQWEIKLTDKYNQPIQAQVSLSINDSLLTPDFSLYNKTAQLSIANNPVVKSKGITISGKIVFDTKVPDQLNAIVFNEIENPNYIYFQLFGNNYSSFGINNIDFEGEKIFTYQLKYHDGEKAKFIPDKDTFLLNDFYKKIDLPNPKQLIFFEKLNQVFKPTLTKPFIDKGTDTLSTSMLKKDIQDRFLYKLSDYVALPTMKATLFDIVHTVRVKSSKKTEMIKVADGQKAPFFKEEPLFMIDNYPYFNNKYLLELNPEEVNSIEVITPEMQNPHWRGIGRFGIVDVKTKEKTYRPSINYNQIYKLKAYAPSKPQQPCMVNKENNTPHYYSRLYWNPATATDSTGKISINFIPNGGHRAYCLIINGYTSDGWYFSKKIAFQK